MLWIDMLRWAHIVGATVLLGTGRVSPSLC